MSALVLRDFQQLHCLFNGHIEFEGEATQIRKKNFRPTFCDASLNAFRDAGLNTFRSTFRSTLRETFLDPITPSFLGTAMFFTFLPLTVATLSEFNF